eukprot:TRINITY_DN8035_c0_g1_i2.p1 TRINITY_DN8035_c0_g1~~TRINITY_DN8035_c0_g1_i2.p1  ORF type:complete len:443 (-),score=55.10 TRINITY_DN8035_c0_g1_i2:96-1361(-)
MFSGRTQHLFLVLLVTLLCDCVLSVKDPSLYERAGEIAYDLHYTKIAEDQWPRLVGELGESHIQMSVTSEGKYFTCFLPKIEESVDNQLPESEQTVKDEVSKHLDSLNQVSCLLLIQQWWIYEFCHKQHVRQFHKFEDGRVTEFFLGIDQNNEYQIKQSYVSVAYTHGTVCDITQQPRTTEIRFQCSGSATSLAIVDITEVSTCQYVIYIEVPQLCRHPKFKPKNVHQETIQCYNLFPKTVPIERNYECLAPTYLYPSENAHCSGGEGMDHHYDQGDRLQASFTNRPSGRWKVLLKFDLRSIPPTVKDIRLIMNPYFVNQVIRQNKGFLEAKVISGEWTESKVTWNSRPTRGEVIANWHPVVEQDHQIDVTSIVLEKIREKQTHFSIQISATPQTGEGSFVSFCSRTYSTKSCIPKLRLCS